MKYLYYTYLDFRTNLAYKTNFVFRFLSVPVSLAIMFFLWSTVYRNSPTEKIAGFGFKELILYYVVIRLLNHAIGYLDVTAQISSEIKKGRILLILSRPLHYVYVQFFSRLFSMSIALGYLAVFLVAFFTVRPLSALSVLFPLLLSIGLAAANFYLLCFILGTSAFFLKNTTGIAYLFKYVFELFSGLLIPFSFAGAKWLWVLESQPFATVLYIPTRILLQRPDFAEMMRMVIIQSCWFLALAALQGLVWRNGLLRFDANGG